WMIGLGEGSPGTRTSTPSPPGQVAVTTVFPAARSECHNGNAVGFALGASPARSYPPIGAPKPLSVVRKGLASNENVLEGMSLCTAVDPVAMAIWLTAVSDGVVTMLRQAKNPFVRRQRTPRCEGK